MTDTAPRPHERIWPARLPRKLAVPATSLWFNLNVTAQRYPDKASTIFFGRPTSYSELHAQAEAVAGWLQSVGVQAGDRVGLYMQNCPQFVASFFGILRANAVVVPINPMNRADEFQHYIIDPEAKVVICSADLATLVDQANSAVPAGQRLTHVLVTRYSDAMNDPGSIDPADAPSAPLEAWLRGDPPLPAPGEGRASYVRWTDALAQRLQPGPHTAKADDLAVLPYTSGTTGNPKGCMHTHRTVMHQTCGIQWSHGGPEAVGLGVVPMFHITGMVGMSAAVFAGSTMVVMPRWDREVVGRAFARYQISHWTCIPTMVIDLFGSPNYKSFDLSSLRFMNGGGAPMPAAVAERLAKEFGIVFAEGYGLTETAAATHGNPPERAKPQCLGIPIFGVESRVIDPTTLKELPAGEVGEIISHGPQIFKGYWRQPDATAAVFMEFEGKTFFRTGDLGRMDEEGYFYLTDRLKRMINASGFKVWPAEVEMLLYKHPAVQEACIIAARDAYRGETVKAVVVLRAEAKGKTTEQDITDWARDHMAAYKVPKLVQFVDSLPKSGSGKVMWRLLQDAEPK
ncbi:long-chain fatty acid--CoA ligase [Sphaerotilaceae bacterium SBD11-9]